MNEKEMKNKIERLEERIEGLESELDEMFKMIEQTMLVKKAVLEIEDYLNKEQNGFDALYFTTLTYSRG